MILSSSPYYKDKVWHSIYNFGYRINISQRTHLISVFNDTMDCIQADARYRAAIELAISKQTLMLETCRYFLVMLVKMSLYGDLS